MSTPNASEACKSSYAKVIECGKLKSSTMGTLCSDCSSEYQSVVDNCKGADKNDKSVEVVLMSCYKVNDQSCNEIWTGNTPSFTSTDFVCNYCIGYKAKMDIDGKPKRSEDSDDNYRECADKYNTAYVNGEIQFASSSVLPMNAAGVLALLLLFK